MKYIFVWKKYININNINKNFDAIIDEYHHINFNTNNIHDNIQVLNYNIKELNSKKELEDNI